MKEALDGNLDSIFSIDKKNTSEGVPDKFDDIVITTGSVIQRKQIKYSNQETSKTLIKNYLSSDSHYQIALHTLFQTWKDVKTPDTEFRLCLAWNEPTDDDIKRVLVEQHDLSSFNEFSTKVFKVNLDNLWKESPENFNNWNSLRKYVRDNNVDRNEFSDFCNDLLIEVNLPKASLKFNTPSELESILIRQAHRLGIEKYPNDDVYVEDFLERLAKKSGVYRTGSVQITVRDILSELRLRTDFGKVEQIFEIDQSKNVSSDEIYDLFKLKVVANKKSILLGEPGAGKSWFLTNFIEHLKDKDNAVIRHYCFTATEDDLLDKRVQSDVFFGNLISDIEEYFPELKKEKEQLYASNLRELNLLLSAIKVPLLIVVDGLDHIERVLKASPALSEEKTRIIDYISKIEAPENIAIILGSQDTDGLKILIDQFGFVKEQLPKWELANTQELMQRFECENTQFEENDLLTLIHKKSEGNLLYLTYILSTLASLDKITPEEVDRLPSYDFNLKSYYEYLTDQIENNVTAEILSCLEFSVSKKELKEIIPVKHHFDSNMKILSPVISENISRGGIKLYHDSFRRFNIEKLSSSAELKDIYIYIINWLECKGFYDSDKSYRYLLRYLILAEGFDKISSFSDNSFLSKSLYFGHSESLVRNNLQHFLFAAKELQSWSLFIYSCELNRAISTTNSEEYHNQFLENFELYFETICIIYGTEKANALLFFNGEKNYSERTIAQAFVILCEYGYNPQWDRLETLFEGGVSLDVFKFYICSLIHSHEDLQDCFKEIISNEYDDYLTILISEVHKRLGFAAIAELYQKHDLDVGGLIAKKIDLALGQLRCIERLSISDKDNDKELPDLDLSFLDSVRYDGALSNFYYNVYRYTESRIEELIEFEGAIPSRNFVYNWIKFFIRLNVIEKKYGEAIKEDDIVKIIQDLALDTDKFKGKPRPVDFSHRHGGLIDRTIEKSLYHIKSTESWQTVITELNKIPHSVLHIIEDKFLDESNINVIIDLYEDFSQLDHEDYSEQAGYAFKKSIYYGKIGDIDKAKEELEKALLLITCYTHRKDRNLAEIIKPLPAINGLDPNFARKYSKQLKYLTDAVMKHTEDGKDTRWLTMEWYQEFIGIDYYLSLSYLVNELLNNPCFWKLDYMFVDLLNSSEGADPIILNILYKLSPTNTKESYLLAFLDVINKIESIDQKQAKLSLINLSIRDWNNSYDRLSRSTEARLHQLTDKYGLSFPCSNEGIKIERGSHLLATKKLGQYLDDKMRVRTSVVEMDDLDLMQFFSNKDRLADEDYNFLYYYLQQCDDESNTQSLLTAIIKKRFPSDGEKRFEDIFFLIERLDLSNELKITLFINNFVYSKDGWFRGFVNKESLKKAVEIDHDLSLGVLASILYEFFSRSDFWADSTSNLIVAFAHAGLDADTVLSMYTVAFDFIESRLPDNSDFEWKDVESSEIFEMEMDEAAIVLILSKSQNLDAYVQKEILTGISYIMNKNEDLLQKPLKWFFNNVERFNQLFVSALLELFLVEADNHTAFLRDISTELRRANIFSNLYIHNTLQEILDRLDNE